jgi:hypothetical protein
MTELRVFTMVVGLVVVKGLIVGALAYFGWTLLLRWRAS